MNICKTRTHKETVAVLLGRLALLCLLYTAFKYMVYSNYKTAGRECKKMCVASRAKHTQIQQ